MAYKDLPPGQMINVTDAWLDPQKSRPKLAAMKRVAPLIEDIEAAHGAVLETHKKDSSAEKALAAIQKKQATLDKVHDRKVRGVYGALTAFADLTDDPAEAEAFLDARDLLCPGGLSFITGSYANEAGTTKFAQDRVPPGTRALLDGIAAPGGTLFKGVQAWWAAGDELGVLEEQRGTLESIKAQDRGEAALQGPRGGQIRARNNWIATVRGVVHMIELEQPDKQTRADLLGPLERALSKAERQPSAETADGDEDIAAKGAAAAETAAEPAPAGK